MVIYPAIDLYDGKAVRLYKGDYAQMTVYSENPVEVAKDFAAKGASHIHLVDLEGAKSGLTPNFETVCAIKKATGLFCEIGGGVRSMDTVRTYLDAGIDRVILGTAAVTEPGFVEEAVGRYGDRIAVGVSGGKDSLVLLLALSEIRKFLPRAFDLVAITVDMGFHTCETAPSEKSSHAEIRALCEIIGVPYIVKETELAHIIFDLRRESNPCSLCSRMSEI